MLRQVFPVVSCLPTARFEQDCDEREPARGHPVPLPIRDGCRCLRSIDTAIAGKLCAWHVGALIIGQAGGRYITLQRFFARQAGQ